MRTVTHREMRNNSGDILRAVAGGESIEVINNGQVAAIVSPPSDSVLARLTAQGSVRLPRRPLRDLATIRRTTSPLSSAEIVADSRGPW